MFIFSQRFLLLWLQQLCCFSTCQIKIVIGHLMPTPWVARTYLGRKNLGNLIKLVSSIVVLLNLISIVTVSYAKSATDTLYMLN